MYIFQGREGANSKVEGPFTFQAILHHNGDIIFAYKTIPVSISLIADEEHPVKVGLSDAYIIERTIFCKRLIFIVILLLVIKTKVATLLERPI